MIFESVPLLKNEKYAVFKREDWELIESRFDTQPLVEIDDAVVIRLQDTFAPPALDAYANCIAAAIVATNGMGDPAIVETLQRIADYFHQMAAISWEMKRHLPD